MLSLHLSIQKIYCAPIKYMDEPTRQKKNKYIKNKAARKQYTSIWTYNRVISIKTRGGHFHPVYDKPQ